MADGFLWTLHWHTLSGVWYGMPCLPEMCCTFEIKATSPMNLYNETSPHSTLTSLLSLNDLWPIHWRQVLSWEWRCSWSSADRRCSNYIWVINNFIANLGVAYIRDSTVDILQRNPASKVQNITGQGSVNSLWISAAVWGHKSKKTLQN